MPLHASLSAIEEKQKAARRLLKKQRKELDGLSQSWDIKACDLLNKLFPIESVDEEGDDKEEFYEVEYLTHSTIECEKSPTVFCVFNENAMDTDTCVVCKRKAVDENGP